VRNGGIVPSNFNTIKKAFYFFLQNKFRQDVSNQNEKERGDRVTLAETTVRFKVAFKGTVYKDRKIWSRYTLID